MFRNRLHPTGFGLGVGMLVIVVWGALWLSTLVELTRPGALRGVPEPTVVVSPA